MITLKKKMNFNNRFEQTSLDNIPTITSMKVGDTEYLDRISSYQMVNDQGQQQNIVKGMDQYCREFITMQLQLLDASAVVIDTGIYTLFRRYTDRNSSLFVFCRSHSSHSNSTAITDIIGANTAVEHWDIFQTLVHNQTSIIPLKYFVNHVQTDVILKLCPL